MPDPSDPRDQPPDVLLARSGPGRRARRGVAAARRRDVIGQGDPRPDAWNRLFRVSRRLTAAWPGPPGNGPWEILDQFI